MKIFLSLVFTLSLFQIHKSYSQGNPPWERPLKIATSNDGTTFNNFAIFQDSSGVPSAVKWHGDTLICAFQWFRLPQNSVTWDKVAVKYSYDGGLNWTQPSPIIINNFPVNFQRPFDPTLAVINNDSIRIYFSSSNGMPVGGLDSSINTYSAVSIDGINYQYENNPRFDHSTNRVIDPAVIYFNGIWHYSAPIGAPQDGAFYCTSNDGINFIQQNNILSTFNRNWTGNFLVNDTNELRFYGSGQQVWFNTSMDGNTWQSYINTNIVGGDPTVVKVNTGNYLAIFVGEPYTVGINENYLPDFTVSPNPFTDNICLKGKPGEKYSYKIYSSQGLVLQTGNSYANESIYTGVLVNGFYVLLIETNNLTTQYKIVK